MTEPRTPLDAALDLMVYAPFGLALTLSEELPKLAEKGRSTLTSRVNTARFVGQFAVTQGRKELNRRLGTGGHPGPAPRPAATSGPVAGPSQRVETAAVPAPTPAAPTKPPPPEASSLAIPGYDSLSASQVVQRLAGLRPDELAAVKAYEEGTRGRRTILSRVAQLQSH